jgi:hypothetical protein
MPSATIHWLLLVFLLTFSKSCALISCWCRAPPAAAARPARLRQPESLLIYVAQRQPGGNRRILDLLVAGAHYQHRLLQLRWLRGDRLARSLTFLHRHGEWAVFFGRFSLRCAPPAPGQRRQRHAVLAFQLANVSSGLLWPLLLLAPGAFSFSFGKKHCLLKRFLNSAICSRINIITCQIKLFFNICTIILNMLP